MTEAEDIKRQILELSRRYVELAHAPKPFVPGTSRIPYSGRVFDDREMTNLVDAALDFWLTAGPYGDRFEQRMRDFFGARDFLLVNSGSSANLVMIATLCSEELSGLLRDGDLPTLKPGDEVITPAVTFPTTLAPILQHQLIPVFVDAEVGTYNIDPRLVEEAIGPRTKALFVPHTVGNPCDMEILVDVSRRHRLWLLEDGCDALGATFNGRLCGTFGDLSSISFYPAHHITMGEGGGVAINHPRLPKTARSIRDWGRDCWCAPGVSNTCGKRFGWQRGELPFGYDHKYVYSNIGYNLKVTDMQAAIGLAQADKIPEFVERRRSNFWRLYEGLEPWRDRFLLPRIDPRANPSPFGFPVTVAEDVDRSALVRHLEGRGIETRLVFGGNILRQPGFLNIPRRVPGSLEQSDIIMRRTFFVGVYPGLSEAMIDYVIEAFGDFARSTKSPFSAVPS